MQYKKIQTKCQKNRGRLNYGFFIYLVSTPLSHDENDKFTCSPGHRNDAKCSRLYFQEMLSVSDANPWLNKEFESGYHAVRHSNRFWAGLWFDRIIEQTLMRSRKCTGGLTRGRGFEENVRIGISGLWVSVTVLLFMNLWSNFRDHGSKYWHGNGNRNCDYDHCQQLTGSKLEIRSTWKMATCILYQQVWSHYIINT